MHNSFITVSSATVGGLSKAFVLGFSHPFISLSQIAEVSLYAAISATIGYAVKLGFDELKRYFRQRREKGAHRADRGQTKEETR